MMKADHQSQQYRLEDRLLKFFPQEIERNQGYIRGFDQDQATVAAHPLPEKDFVGTSAGRPSPKPRMPAKRSWLPANR